MFRPLAKTVAATLVFASLASVATAQDWARKMFEEKEHDFGVVARGSDTVFRFPVKNIYKEDVVLGSVRSSCGCTSASLEHPVIKTFEKGYIVAKFNTRTFTGDHGATLTVQITKPYPAQVQVRVKGNIRGDVVFEPGSADFGQFDQGTLQQKKVSVSYAGRGGWKIDDVRSSNDHLEAELIERERSGRGRVIYDLSVRLRESAPAGFLKTQLVLITNDRANPRIPIEVTAQVRPELTVAPATLVLGDVPQGETVTKRLLVRGKRPFRVTSVNCEDECFEFETGETPDTKQIVTLKFVSGGEARRLKAPIVIQTDLGDSFTTTSTAYATVTPSSATAAEQGSSTTTTPDSHAVSAR